MKTDRMAIEIVDDGAAPSRMLVRRTARFTRAAVSGIPDSDLAIINRFALKPLTADDVIVRDARIANDQPDSYNTQFAPAALEQVAAMLAGAPVMRNHATYGADDLPVGRWFRCWNEQDEDGTSWAEARMYMVRDPITESLAARMDGGIISEVSLSWWMSREALQCSVCGNNPWDERCTHIPGEMYGDRACVTVMNRIDEVDEASIVWKGGQYNTRITLPDDEPDAIGYQSSRDMLVQRLAARSARLQSVAPAEVSPLQAWWDEPHKALREWFHNAG